MGINHRPQGRGADIGFRLNKASVYGASAARQVDKTHAGMVLMEPEQMADRLNSMLLDWSNYFGLGQVTSDLQYDWSAFLRATPSVSVSKTQAAKRIHAQYFNQKLYDK
ncbi:MAG: hypothetical protein OXD44_07205 [Gammaproteobacteria bacterium]|nr:hypothetical protein [Gammaproteobacteria bacterium]MCY4313466.1 hypothetical protein [Gammaproteobacteria bacterium]